MSEVMEAAKTLIHRYSWHWQASGIERQTTNCTFCWECVSCRWPCVQVMTHAVSTWIFKEYWNSTVVSWSYRPSGSRTEMHPTCRFQTKTTCLTGLLMHLWVASTQLWWSCKRLV